MSGPRHRNWFASSQDQNQDSVRYCDVPGLKTPLLDTSPENAVCLTKTALFDLLIDWTANQHYFNSLEGHTEF